MLIAGTQTDKLRTIRFHLEEWANVQWFQYSIYI